MQPYSQSTEKPSKLYIPLEVKFNSGEINRRISNDSSLYRFSIWTILFSLIISSAYSFVYFLLKK